MHGRSFVAVSVAGGLALVYAVLVPVASVAEDVGTAEQPAAPTGATTPSSAVPSPSPPNAVPPSAAVPPQTEVAAPAPVADPVIAGIRNKLADPNLRKGVHPADLAALDAFYAQRSGPPVWVTPMGFSSRAQATIDEIGKADDWGLSASAFQLPSAGILPKTADEQAVAEIKLQLAVLKYARFARGGRVNPSNLSSILDLDPPIRDPKIVLAEISVSPTPDNYLQSLHPKHEQFQNLRQALLKARGGDGASKPASERDIQRIVINMERWRWMPENLGKIYVQDNVPEYMLYVVKDGKVIHSDKIVVGLLKYATPVFSANMQSIVFNPEWTVPPTIVRENLLPNLRGGGWFGGGSILSEHGLKVRYNGRIVDAGSVNWSSVNMANIAFVQAPGPTNVLGKLKFVYPNKHMVYMHDTIKRGLFKPSMRAEGHNCIRMERPSQLAQILLAEDKGWDTKKVQDLLDKGYDSAVNLDHPIPVHTTYFTAVADADGKVTSFADVYALDSKLAPIVSGKAIASAAIDDDNTDTPTGSVPAARSKPPKENVAGQIQGLFGD
ncbi:MAG TPA: L,D-transpeptidase family protein [Methyloceanibacter sp.]|nr:L,D-transpeptidase family protein [Methyloceanibacter sp.]